MAKRQIALNLRSFHYESLNGFATIIYKGFIKMAAVYTSPVPPLVDQKAAIDKLTASLKKWGSKGNPRGSDLDLAYVKRDVEAIKSNLRRSAEYVRSVTPDDPEKWMEVGFVLKKLPSKTGITPPVQWLRQVTGRTIPPNQAWLRWKRPLEVPASRIITYRVYRSKDEHFAHAQYLDTVVNKARFIDDKVPSTGKWNYWVIPKTTAGDGMISNLCTALVWVD